MTEQVLVFTLGDTQYCVEIDAVNEIVETGDIAEIPNAAEHVRGVMDLRGETTTIVDPKRVFGTPDESTADRVIIFATGDDQSLGWLVDGVHEVADLAREELESVSDDDAVRGVIKEDDRFILWIDPASINETIDRSRPAK